MPIFNLKIHFILIVFLSTTVSCVLKKRDQTKKVDPKQASAKEDIGIPTIKNVPIKNIPGHLDHQAQLDLEAFDNPVDVEAIEKQNQKKEEILWKTLTGHKMDFKLEMNQSKIENKNSAISNDMQFLAYTDSGSDLLINKLRVLNNESSLTREQKIRNLEFAKEISSIKILDSRGTLFSVSIQYETGRYKILDPQTNSEKIMKDKLILQTKRLSGYSKFDGRYAELTESLDTSTDTDRMMGILRCLDLNFKNKCSTYLLTIELKKADGAKLEASAVLRTAKAKISDVKMNLQNSGTPRSSQLALLYDLFNKTYDDHYFEDKYITLQSLAVVEGISEFKLELHTNKVESVNIGGPLITGLGNSLPTNFLLTKNFEFKTFQQYSNTSNNSVSLNHLFDTAHLNFNNGRGKLKISFAKSINAQPPSLDSSTQSLDANDEISVTFTNETPPIVPLTKESLLFTLPSL